jgi:DNA-binding response OmpR family regulator
VLLIGHGIPDSAKIREFVNQGTIVLMASTVDLVLRWLGQVEVREPRTSQLCVDELRIDLHEYRAWWRESTLPLTNLELHVLAHLVRRDPNVTTYEELQEAWGSPYYGDASHLRSEIKRLRRKLKEARVALSIEAVRGVGFRLCRQSD